MAAAPPGQAGSGELQAGPAGLGAHRRAGRFLLHDGRQPGQLLRRAVLGIPASQERAGSAVARLLQLRRQQLARPSRAHRDPVEPHLHDAGMTAERGGEGPGQTTGDVLLLLSDGESAGLLAEMLARGRRVTIAESEGALDGRYDLGCVAGPTRHRFWRRIVERKRSESPSLLPFLLVTTPNDVGLFARFLWTAVDELIQTPVQAPELLARVDLLLRSREASLRLRDHSEERFRHFFE